MEVASTSVCTMLLIRFVPCVKPSAYHLHFYFVNILNQLIIELYDDMNIITCFFYLYWSSNFFGLSSISKLNVEN